MISLSPVLRSLPDRVRRSRAVRRVLGVAANPAWGQRLIAVVFLAVILAGSAGTFARMLSDIESFPAVRSFKKFPGQCESFVDNHLAGRYSLLRWNATLKIEALGVSPTPRVWIGTDNWLFFNHRAELPAEAQTEQWISEGVDHWGRLMRARRDWCEARGAKFLAVVAPDKQSVYSDHLPDRIRKRGADPVLDRVLDRWREEPAVAVVDPREALREAAAEGPVYLHADSHWSPFGAWIGYNQVARALNGYDFRIVPLTRKDLNAQLDSVDCCDLWWLLALPGDPPVERVWWPHLKERRAIQRFDDSIVPHDGRFGHLRPCIWTNASSDGPRIVLFCDSFADDRFQELLARHCSRLVVVPAYLMSESLVEREKPDFVICETVERYLTITRPPFPGK